MSLLLNFWNASAEGKYEKFNTDKKIKELHENMEDMLKSICH